MNLSRVIRISRPRFWIYELWPYMIGILAAMLMWWSPQQPIDYLLIALYAIYFLVWSNIWIYGINDIYDYETDKLNPKKLNGYEALVLPTEQPKLRNWILWTTLPFVGILFAKLSRPFILTFVWFLFFSGMYSAYPIRAKAKPIIDMIFSAGHYVMTAIFAWTLIAPIAEINWRYIVAGMCWCMAMHLYSAVPDIQADAEAWLSTTAMLTGEHGGLVLCMIFYALAAILSYPALWVISLILWLVYLVMMIWTWLRLRDISQIYTYFPWVNMISGMFIFLTLLYTLIYG